MSGASPDNYGACGLEVSRRDDRRVSASEISLIEVSKYVTKVDETIDYNSVNSLALIKMNPKEFRLIYNKYLDEYSKDEIEQILNSKKQIMINEGTLCKGYNGDIFKIQIQYSQSMYNQMINAKVKFYRNIIDGIIIVTDSLIYRFAPGLSGTITKCINPFNSLIQSSLREYVEDNKLEESLDENVKSVINFIYSFPPQLRVVLLVTVVVLISCICSVIGGSGLAIGVSEWISQTIGCLESNVEPPSIAKVASRFLSSLDSDGGNDKSLKKKKVVAAPKQNTVKSTTQKNDRPGAILMDGASAHTSRSNYAPPPFD